MEKAEREVRRISRETASNMTALGTYRPQFEAAIRAYSQLRQQYDQLTAEFYARGCPVTEEYTNKAGFTNVRKTALYLALETLRRDVVNHENLLGLTPAGLKKINDELKGKPEASRLEEIIRGFG